MQSFKIKSLKKISAIVAVAIGIASYQSAQAATFTATGRVNNVSVADSTPSTSRNSVTLVGVSSLGSCPAVFGVVLFSFKDDLRGQQMLAVALAAATSGSSVFVNADDTNRDPNGFCYATGIGVSGN